MREVRNKWAHQRPFSDNDAYNALDSMHKLLSAMGSPQAEAVNDLKLEQFRTVSDAQIQRIAISGTHRP